MACQASSRYEGKQSVTVYTLAYHSRNNQKDLTPDSLSALQTILTVARARNTERNVTGALMFNEGRFTQILEGDRKDVLEIFESIKRDTRHNQITLVSLHESFARRFPSWSMAFVGSSERARAYYSTFVNNSDFDWATISGDALGRLMTELVDLDLRSSLDL